MSYFDPKIYCKQNLKEEDRKELDYWRDVFLNVIENAKFEAASLENGILGQMKNEIIADFCEEVKDSLGSALQDNVVGIIDAYEEDVEEVENPETYLEDYTEGNE